MSEPCEWCVKTSGQIDGIEYELEQHRLALFYMIGRLSVVIDDTSDEIKQDLTKEYGLEFK